MKWKLGLCYSGGNIGIRNLANSYASNHGTITQEASSTIATKLKLFNGDVFLVEVSTSKPKKSFLALVNKPDKFIEEGDGGRHTFYNRGWWKINNRGEELHICEGYLTSVLDIKKVPKVLYITAIYGPLA